MRAGEVLETVPGLVVSQHSGEGKANQYYLRGFNLDHGTDFSTTVAGVPVNTPTGAHAHGYADVSFLIPELVSGVQFKKGPYFADEGDFSAAGAANINYLNQLERPMVRLSAGNDGWGRIFGAASPRVADGHLRGFHSNDARGAVVTVDPVPAEPVDRVTLGLPHTLSCAPRRRRAPFAWLARALARDAAV
jgi:hypothetical protein